nr:retrovirus-related Pol polyprotein from transposon TNT 1-94 [Tanacetum cinerariifolium]
KTKRVKDAAYHREKMLLCKQEEAGIQLNTEQADWRDDSDDESKDQELEAHYIAKEKLCAHQETISILSQQKEAQLKLYKTCEDNELDKVIALENKVKVLDNIVYKTDQSVQTMNMLNNKCQTSFAKPEFLKKAQRANPRMYDIGCYNDNLALMLAFESDEDLRAQLQDKGIVISESKKLIEKLKGKYVDTKFEKSSVIREPNAFKSQRPSILGKPTTFSNSFERKDFSKSKPVTQNNVSNDFSKPVTAQTWPPNKKSILKNMNVLAPGMYKLHTKSNQARTSQLSQDSRKTNKRVSFSTGVIPTTSVSRPQLKSNPMGDRVMSNNIQGKKQEVEDQRRNVKCSKNKTFVTACNDSLNAKTLNVNSVSAMCDKCMLNDKHDMRSTVSSTPLSSNSFAARRDCPIHHRLWNFLGTVKFGNDQIVPILGYGDLVQRAVTIKRVYYVEGLNHNLFFVGQFCDADLEVAFRKSTCYIRDLKGNDLLTGSRGTDLYSITLQDTNCPNPICLMAKVTSSQAWLWHRCLSYLNFDTINLLSENDIVVGLPKLKFIKDHLCSSCELGKAKRNSFHTKITPSSKRRLQLLHKDLCGPMRVASINGKRYVLTLHAYFAAEGILHQTSVARTPKQNGVVERRNRTLVEAARTMLSAAKVPLFFWAEAIATTCFTQNRSLVIP